jgi:fatty-acyl-CoA synthase
MIVGGSALPQGLARLALERGIDVFAGYGMSETCPVLTVSHVKSELAADPERALEVRTLTGLPLPLVDLRVVDEDMRDVPHDGKAVGEVVVRAPWLTQAYAGEPGQSETLWHGGYLHTNDIGAIDAHGYLRVTDRIKDVIKTGGEWVSSLQIEDLVSRHPSVAEVAVIGISDPRWGERPVAFVVPHPEQAVETEAIRIHLEAYVHTGLISKYAVPERVLVVDTIAKTSVGKANKRLLREQCARLLQACER